MGASWVYRGLATTWSLLCCVRFGTFFAYHTQEEIADIVGVPRRTVADWLDQFGEIGQLSEIAKFRTEYTIQSSWNGGTVTTIQTSLNG